MYMRDEATRSIETFIAPTDFCACEGEGLLCQNKAFALTSSLYTKRGFIRLAFGLDSQFQIKHRAIWLCGKMVVAPNVKEITPETYLDRMIFSTIFVARNIYIYHAL